MIKNKTLFGAVLFVLALFLAACGSAPPETEPTPQPDTVLTAAAQTAEARLTELSQPTATPTETPAPTIDLAPPPTLDLGLTPTVDLALTPTAGLGTTPTAGLGTNPTAPVIITTPAAGASGDLAEFVADITIPDGEDMDPGEAFTKVWRLRNAGTTTWTTDYQFVFIGGAQMDAPAEVPIPQSVAPGDTVDISVSMVAPQESGLQRGFWQMRNPAGELFQSSVYVEVEVIGGVAAPAGTSAPSGSTQVSNVSLSVDDASPDECPFTFTFTGGFNLSESTTVNYRLEAGANTAGVEFEMPADRSDSFSAGQQSVTYTMNISDSVDGWAQLHVLSPDDASSDQVAFSLDCDD